MDKFHMFLLAVIMCLLLYAGYAPNIYNLRSKTKLITHQTPAIHFSESTNCLNLSSAETDRGCDRLDFYIKCLSSEYRKQSYNSNKPLIHKLDMPTQGIGRVFETAARSVLLSAFFGRPFLLDLSSQDPYYSVRSFFEPRMFDFRILDAEKLDLENTENFLEMKITQEEKEERNSPGFENNFIHKLRSEKEKYLINRNFGTFKGLGWESLKLLRKPLKKFLTGEKSAFDCEDDSATRLFKPTDRLLNLFTERRKLLFSLGQSEENLASFHIRTYFIKKNKRKYILESVQKCLLSELTSGISVISVFSDEPKISGVVSDELEQIFTNFSFKTNLVTELENAKYSAAHSAFEATKKSLDDTSLGTTMADFFTMMNSKILFYTQGAFGEQAGKFYNKKCRKAVCGTENVMFNLCIRKNPLHF
eukprot:snap_masked-scaffold_27-processed-gene-0.20-mRNA-1 protein AED:1.00 eAED:1.00 QI:0/-1/0/0/-1/1/1/0/418